MPTNRTETGIAQRIQYLTEPQVAVQISDRTGTALFTAPQNWNATTGWGVLGGQGTFTSIASGLVVVQADFNGDGLADPVVVSPTSLIGSSSAVLLLTGEDGIGTRFKLFSAPSQGQYFFAAAGDFNGDSKLDLALLSRVAGQPSQVNVQVFLGQGEGNFFSEVNLKVGQGVMSATVGSFNGNASLSVGDRNGDGAVDIVLTHIAPTGTSLDILLSGADGAFHASQWWAAPGPYSLQIRGNQVVVTHSGTEPTPPPLPEPPPITVDEASSDEEEAGSDTPVDPPAPVIEPPAEPAPIVVQTSVEGTGLAVEVAIDSNVLPVAGQTYDQTFWGQIVSAREVLVNDGGDAPTTQSTATDPHTTTVTQQSAGEGKPTPAGSATSANTGIAKTHLGGAREGSLVDILGEEHFGLPDKSADHTAWLGQNLALQVGAWQAAASPIPAARVGDEQPYDAEVLLSQQGPRLESKPGSLLLGLDDDVIAPLLLVRASGGSDEGAATELSVLDVGQALLQAMIIVKMTPGGSGPDNRGVPGVVAPNDSLMRIAELVKDSSQFLTRLVRSFYQRYLGRDAENGEEQGWVQMLLGGEREESVLSSFLSTREFGQHADALIDAGTPDEKYLQSLYILVLDRTPSTGEVAAWLQSPEGLNRQQAALALVSSNEFRVQQIEDMFRDSLQREPGGDEAIHWAATPFGLRDIRQFFATHPEWFQQP